MPGIALFPVFLVGLLGSVHCAAMCGGIVGALSVGGARPAPPAFPVPVRTVTARPAANLAAYNTGRIASYMAAGALAGGAAGFAALPGLHLGLPCAQFGVEQGLCGGFSLGSVHR